MWGDGGVGNGATERLLVCLSLFARYPLSRFIVEQLFAFLGGSSGDRYAGIS